MAENEQGRADEELVIGDLEVLDEEAADVKGGQGEASEEESEEVQA